MTPILSNILPLVAAHARSQAAAFCQGEASFGGSALNEIVEFLDQKDVDWGILSVADRDSLYDAYLCAVQKEMARRLTPSDPEASSLPQKVGQEASSGVDAVLSCLKTIRHYIDGLEYSPHKTTMTKGWNFMVYGMEDPGAVVVRPDWLKSFTETAAAASGARPEAPSAPEVVKIAEKALEMALRYWKDYAEADEGEDLWISLHREADDFRSAQSALSSLRLLTAEGNPEGLRPPAQELPPREADVPPLGRGEAKLSYPPVIHPSGGKWKPVACPMDGSFITFLKHWKRSLEASIEGLLPESPDARGTSPKITALAMVIDHMEACESENEELGRILKECGANDGEFLTAFLARKFALPSVTQGGHADNGQSKAIASKEASTTPQKGGQGV